MAWSVASDEDGDAIRYRWSLPHGSTGKSTRIFVKENGRWLCIHGHYTLRP